MRQVHSSVVNPVQCSQLGCASLHWLCLSGATVSGRAQGESSPCPAAFAVQAVENFLAFCKGVDVGGRALSYVGCPFTRVVRRFVVQAGDVVNKDGTGEGERMVGRKGGRGTRPHATQEVRTPAAAVRQLPQGCLPAMLARFLCTGYSTTYAHSTHTALLFAGPAMERVARNTQLCIVRPLSPSSAVLLVTPIMPWARPVLLLARRWCTHPLQLW